MTTHDNLTTTTTTTTTTLLLSYSDLVLISRYNRQIYVYPSRQFIIIMDNLRQTFTDASSLLSKAVKVFSFKSGCFN